MQLDLWQILVLAIVQGVTEFLPISSSGHLVVVAALLSPDDPGRVDISDLNVVLHLGTLLSIVVYYWRRLWRLLGEDRRVIGLLFVATLPAVVVGLPIEMFFDFLLEIPLLAGAMLIVTGVFLLWSGRGQAGEDDYHQLGYKRALLIGVSQAFALLPGISRSGTTIGIGMRMGLAPRSAAAFSFLMAIPVIGGSGLLKAASLVSSGESVTAPGALALGAAVAFVVGIASLSLLERWLARGRFHWFAWWCIPLGGAVVLWQLSL